MKLIVIEGLDGSGKATQTGLLAETLAKKGIPFRRISFPDYQKPWSVPVKMYLDGAFGEKADDVGAYAASLLFAVDRFVSYRADWQKDYLSGKVMLCDRYVGSNAIHQSAKLPQNEREDFISWLCDLEFNKLGLPRPWATIYLKVDPDVSQRLLSRRYGSDESKKDIHERDPGYLSRCQKAASFAADLLGWHTVECCRAGGLLPREEIALSIENLLSDLGLF